MSRSHFGNATIIFILQGYSWIQAYLAPTVLSKDFFFHHKKYLETLKTRVKGETKSQVAIPKFTLWVVANFQWSNLLPLDKNNYQMKIWKFQIAKIVAKNDSVNFELLLLIELDF